MRLVDSKRERKRGGREMGLIDSEGWRETEREDRNGAA